MMERSQMLLVVVGVLTVLCGCLPVHGEFLHAGEVINRENIKTALESSVRLYVNPSVYLTSGDWVKLTWRYVSSPSSYDWIGLYSPPHDDVYRINPTLRAPIKIQFANSSDDHTMRGRGRVYFKMMNMRHPVVFGFFRGGFVNPTLVSISNTLHFWNYNAPMQGHLALTGNPTTMALQWSTLNKKMPAVYYGTESGDYKYFTKASTKTYDASMMCNSPANDWGWREPGLLHTAVMENLTPGQKYYYVYGDYYGWSSEKSFKAAPRSNKDVTTNIIAFGDMGCGEEDGSVFLLNNIQPDSINTTHMILKQMDRGSIDFILHLGDLSYARGFSSVWDIFFNQIEPIATRIPYMVAMGNFERNTPPLPPHFNGPVPDVTLSGTEPQGECGVPYSYRFPMPKTSLKQSWYFFNYGKAHFIIMSTEHDFEEGSAQWNAIRTSLMNVDRKETPWVIVGGHRPMYVASTVGDHQKVARELRKHIEPLLKIYKVDLALWAHHHSYQRTCHVFRRQCRSSDRAPIHVLVGVGGQDIAYELIPDQDPSWMDKVDYYHHGFSKISYNSTTLEVQFVRHQKGEVFDRFVLKKGASGEGSGYLAEETTEEIATESPLGL